jgi:hypothetical protein
MTLEIVRVDGRIALGFYDRVDRGGRWRPHLLEHRRCRWRRRGGGLGAEEVVRDLERTDALERRGHQHPREARAGLAPVERHHPLPGCELGGNALDTSLAADRYRVLPEPRAQRRVAE